MTTPARQPARQTAFVSPPVDLMLVGGFSILHFLVFSMPGLVSLTGLYAVAGWSAVLVWVINHPHFSATSHRLYRSRENIMQFPLTALGIPVLLLATVTAALMFPTTIGPWFVKVFLIWSPYHFSAQTLGIALLYARRSGFTVTLPLRRAMTIFIFSTYLGPTLAAETGGNQHYYGLVIPVFGLPYVVWPLFLGIIAISGIVALMLLLREAWKQDRRVPLLMIIPPLAQYVWFIPGSTVQGFQEFVPAYHSLQYLLIAWVMNLKERSDEGQLPRSPARATLESIRWFILNVAGGVFLFYLLPRMAGASFTIDPYVATGITVAAVQIHHFFVDGVIWKLRNPKVGQPLMTDWAQLTGRA